MSLSIIIINKRKIKKIVIKNLRNSFLSLIKINIKKAINKKKIKKPLSRLQKKVKMLKKHIIKIK